MIDHTGIGVANMTVSATLHYSFADSSRGI
jgi:hypothetical protein